MQLSAQHSRSDKPGHARSLQCGRTRAGIRPFREPANQWTSCAAERDCLRLVRRPRLEGRQHVRRGVGTELDAPQAPRARVELQRGLRQRARVRHQRRQARAEQRAPAVAALVQAAAAPCARGRVGPPGAQGCAAWDAARVLACPTGGQSAAKTRRAAWNNSTAGIGLQVNCPSEARPRTQGPKEAVILMPDMIGTCPSARASTWHMEARSSGRAARGRRVPSCLRRGLAAPGQLSLLCTQTRAQRRPTGARMRAKRRRRALLPARSLEEDIKMKWRVVLLFAKLCCS